MHMSPSVSEQFAQLTALIKEVKPGLGDTAIRPEDSLVEHLGLDSLDILQLSRKVNRQIGTFDLDAFNAGARTVQSILDQTSGATESAASAVST
jgi:acyl carrier protein